VPTLLVESGFFLSEDSDAHGKLRPDTIVKNDWVMKGYEEFPLDVANVSSHDLKYFAAGFLKSASKSQALLNSLVGANIVSESSDINSPRPFLIREIPSRQPGEKATKIAFVGLTETKPAAPAGFKFIDFVEAARRSVPEAKKSADLIVILAKLSTADAARVAREVPGIDIIIDGNAESLAESFTPPFYVGKTLIVFTPFETRMLGELRFYRGAQGKFTTKQRFVALDEAMVPEDPVAKKIVDAATAKETEARSQSKTLLEDWLSRSRMRIASKSTAPATGDPAGYVTSSACSKCHLEQYVKWANSAHAHATDPLPPRAVEFETGCLACHSTGSVPIPPSRLRADLQSVQCEQCHGPGGAHAAKPTKGYGVIADMKKSCGSCHTSETSPRFDLQAAWQAIKH